MLFELIKWDQIRGIGIQCHTVFPLQEEAALVEALQKWITGSREAEDPTAQDSL